MFTVSDCAADAIRRIVTRSGAPEDTGLRVAPGGDDSEWHLSLVPRPQPGDIVYRTGGAQVFLDEHADKALAGQAIAVVHADDGSGGVQFIISPAAG